MKVPLLSLPLKALIIGGGKIIFADLHKDKSDYQNFYKIMQCLIITAAEQCAKPFGGCG